MSYDLHGTWDSTNPMSVSLPPNSPRNDANALLSSGSIVQAHTNLTEIKLATELFWRVDIAPHKIALGFGFYGRAFTLQDPSCTEPGCPFSGGADAGSCTATSGCRYSPPAARRANNLTPCPQIWLITRFRTSLTRILTSKSSMTRMRRSNTSHGTMTSGSLTTTQTHSSRRLIGRMISVSQVP